MKRTKKERQQAYYKANRESILAKHKARVEARRSDEGWKAQRRAISRKHYAKNREAIRVVHREYREGAGREVTLVGKQKTYERKTATAWGRAAILVSAAKSRAAERGEYFSLTIEWVAERLERGVCEATARPFRPLAARGPRTDDSPTLDRIDNTRGYTPDNVMLVCWAYNNAKGNRSPELLAAIGAAFVRLFPST